MFLFQSANHESHVEMGPSTICGREADVARPGEACTIDPMYA